MSIKLYDVIMDERIAMKLNGVHIDPWINFQTKVITLNGLPQSDLTVFEFEFPTGLKNPLIGPYSYRYP